MFNSMLDELREVKYFKEIKGLKSVQVKAEAYLGPKLVYMKELFLRKQLTNYYFCKKHPSQIFHGVPNRPMKILKSLR